MNDPNLCARLDALERDLRACASPSTWKELDLPYIWKYEQVWKRIDAPIRQQVDPLLEDLQSVRTELAGINSTDLNMPQQCETVWANYAKIYNDSQEIFQECLELIGGLVMRDRRLDDGICQVADELIVNCSTEVGEEATVTIPASQEALRKTMGRIIRFRFPEWTYWTLPFTAHEYGHVVIDEKKSLRKYVKRKIKELVPGAADQNGLTEEQLTLQQRRKARAERRAEFHIEELLADAFATYTMGPAYACATLLHRFNNYSAFVEDDEHPSDGRRAYMVLMTLTYLNEKTGSNEYEAIINFLREEWDRILAMPSQQNGILSEGDMQYLDRLLAGVLKIFDRELMEARYKDWGKIEGWEVARTWGKVWQKELHDEKAELTQINIRRHNRVRDVLNAAWYCRVQLHMQVTKQEQVEGVSESAALLKGKLDKIAQVTEKTCDAIIDERTNLATRDIRDKLRKQREERMKDSFLI